MKFFKNSYYLLACCFLFPFYYFSKSIPVCKDCTVKKIETALSLAKNGDVLELFNEKYSEFNLKIDKKITLKGKKNSIIDVKGKGNGILIYSDDVQINTLQINNVKTSYTDDLAGIKLKNVNNCTVKNVTLNNTFFGIYLSKSNNCKLINNVLKAVAKKESSSGNGIHLWYCNQMIIKGNKISGHRDGIYLEFVKNSKIFNNLSKKQIRYGLHFMFSSNNHYQNNRFINNGAGVAVMYSKNIRMNNNVFSENWSKISNGLLLKDITDSKIYKNYFKKNTMGILAEGCNRMLIKNNDFIENGWAIKILGNCYNNRIIYNNFMSNTFEIVTNSSTNNNLFEYNFWNQYSGYDINKDGIGDVPHSPITLFCFLNEKIPESMVLLRSNFVDLLNLTEKITPVLTPESFKDFKPRMKKIQWYNS
ncbi:MAG: nitrous oxide reductase family maturation protein NosD [Flavobacteriia bacterium]|nr:nitrous oxide reductase family maturation protein NosD [Flavobacteriia bacterium]